MPTAENFYDLFVSTATAEEIAGNDLQTLTRQIAELRAAEPDDYDFTNAEIARLVRYHARSLLNCIVCGEPVDYEDPGWFEHQLGDECGDCRRKRDAEDAEMNTLEAEAAARDKAARHAGDAARYARILAEETDWEA